MRRNRKSLVPSIALTLIVSALSLAPGTAKPNARALSTRAASASANSGISASSIPGMRNLRYPIYPATSVNVNLPPPQEVGSQRRMTINESSTQLKELQNSRQINRSHAQSERIGAYKSANAYHGVSGSTDSSAGAGLLKSGGRLTQDNGGGFNSAASHRGLGSQLRSRRRP